MGKRGFGWDKGLVGRIVFDWGAWSVGCRFAQWPVREFQVPSHILLYLMLINVGGRSNCHSMGASAIDDCLS